MSPENLTCPTTLWTARVCLESAQSFPLPLRQPFSCYFSLCSRVLNKNSINYKEIIKIKILFKKFYVNHCTPFLLSCFELDRKVEKKNLGQSSVLD